MIPSIRIVLSGKGKGIGVVVPMLAAVRDTNAAIDVKNDLRQGGERD